MPVDCGLDIQSAINAIGLYHTQYDQVDKLWGYFGTVTLAILGFSIGVEKVTRSFLEASIIVAGYWMFSYGNYEALTLGQGQLRQFASFAQEQATLVNIPLKDLSSPFGIDKVRSYYFGVVGAVSLGILGITLVRRPTS